MAPVDLSKDSRRVAAQVNSVTGASESESESGTGNSNHGMMPSTSASDYAPDYSYNLAQTQPQPQTHAQTHAQDQGVVGMEETETVHSIPLANLKDPEDVDIHLDDQNQLQSTVGGGGGGGGDGGGQPHIDQGGYPNAMTIEEELSRLPDQDPEVYLADYGGKQTRNTLSTPKHLLKSNARLLPEGIPPGKNPEIFQVMFYDKRLGKDHYPGETIPAYQPSTSTPAPNPKDEKMKASAEDAISLSADSIANLAKGIPPSAPAQSPERIKKEEKKTQPLNSAPLPPPTWNELIESKPHPEAYFIPSQGIWILVVEASDFVEEHFRRHMIDYNLAMSSAQPNPTFLPFECLDSTVPIYEKESRTVRLGDQISKIEKFNPLISRRSLQENFGANDDETSISNTNQESESESPKHFLWQFEEDLPEFIEPEMVESFNVFTNLNPRSITSSARNEKERISKQKIIYCSGTPSPDSPVPTITSIIPTQLFEKLVSRRRAFPFLGESGLSSAKKTFKMLIKIVSTAALGNTRAIPLGSKALTTKLGKDKYSMIIFKLLGFSFGILEDGRECITPPPMKVRPPSSSTASPGKEDSTSQKNRCWKKRLIRGWIEMEIWYKWKFQESPSEEQVENPFWLKVVDGLPELERKFGYQKNQDLSFEEKKRMAEENHDKETEEAYDILGVAPDAHDDVIANAYKANRFRNPAKSRLYFTALSIIFYGQRVGSDRIQPLVDLEERNGNFTQRQLEEAYAYLSNGQQTNGVGLTNAEILRNLDYQINIGVPDIKEAYLHLARVSILRGRPQELESRIPQGALDSVYGAGWGEKDSLMINNYWQESMTKEEAYRTFNMEPNVDIDDATLLTIYEVALMDSPDQKQKFDLALKIFAQERNSRFLENFLKTGSKDESLVYGDEGSKPTGINNIGNTCFLNSVLQYFFILIEIRNRVLNAELIWEAEGISEANQSEAEKNGKGSKAEGRRVGGRVVTKKEIERSRKFVKYLAQLFNAMISSPFPAVTPERELAYLALVSSRAEEGVKFNPTSNDQNVEMSNAKEAVLSENSNGTDSTLVEEPGQISIIQQVGKEDHTQLAASKDLDLIDPQSKIESQPQLSTNEGNGDVEMAPPPEYSAHEIDLISNKENESIADVSMKNEDSQPQPQPQPQPPAAAAAPTQTRPQHALPSKPDFSFQDDNPNTQNSLMQLGAQQDVSECLDNVMFQLEVALGSKVEGMKAEGKYVDEEEEIEGDDLLPKLFRGRTAQRVQLANPDSASASPSKPLAASSVHVKREIFKILPVEVVEEGNDLYDSLDGFFDEEVLIGESGKSVIRSVTLVDPPPILQIQIQRVQYDRVKGLFKNQAHLDVQEKIYLDRYLDFDLEDEERPEKRRQSRIRRKEINALREKIKVLKPDNQPTIPATLNTVGSYLSKLRGLQLPPFPEVSTSAESQNQEPNQSNSTPLILEPLSALPALKEGAFPDFIADYSKVLDQEILEYQKKIAVLKAEVEALWSEEKRVEYQLVSVFMHRGEASHGHYWICQRQFPESDPAQESTWFKYNDSVVTQISRSEVLRDTTGATPYLLCFVRSDLQSDAQTALIETVKREIESGNPQGSHLPTAASTWDGPNNLLEPFYPSVPPPPNSETENMKTD